MKAKIPPEARTRALLVAAQGGNKRATDTLVRESMPLVEAVVSRQGRPDLREDLLQAGLCGSSEGQREGEPARAGGLMRAIATWDPAKRHAGKPIRWSTWATWWIRAGVQAEMCKLGPLMGPNRRALKRRAKVRKAAAALEAKLGRVPEAAEVAGALKVPERPGIIEAALRPLPKPLTGPSDPGREGKRVWEDLRSGNTPTPEQALDLQRQIQRVRDAVEALPPLERSVIAGAFGIEERELTPLELAARAGLSRCALYRVRARALELLREALGDLEVRERIEDLDDINAQGNAFGELGGHRVGPGKEAIDAAAGNTGGYANGLTDRRRR